MDSMVERAGAWWRRHGFSHWSWAVLFVVGWVLVFAFITRVSW